MAANQEHPSTAPAASVATAVEPAAESPRTFVLDTSVLIADPHAMLRFAEHHVVLPLTVITEPERKRNDPIPFFRTEFFPATGQCDVLFSIDLIDCRGGKGWGRQLIFPKDFPGMLVERPKVSILCGCYKQQSIGCDYRTPIIFRTSSREAFLF